jgi:hypothetical protein
MKKKIKKVNIRAFSRKMYDYTTDLPIVVYNKYSQKPLFVVISVEEGGAVYELSAKDSVQSKK